MNPPLPLTAATGVPTLTHALVLYALLAVPMLAGLFHGRASLVRFLVWPFAATLVAAILGVIQSLLPAALMSPDVASTLGGWEGAMTCATPILGYVLGRLAARSLPAHTHQRGTRLADGRRAQRDATVLVRRDPGRLTLAGVAVEPLDETKHFKLIGTTGSGKSTAIRQLLRTALARGDRALIADPDGGYLSRFYDPYRGDEILNPFDPRSVRWDLFGELRDPYDADQLARALIPDSSDASGREWRAYARTFLAALLRPAGCAGARPKSASPIASAATPATSPTPNGSQPSDLAELWRRLAIASAEELRPLVQNTPAQPFLERDNARMFGSIRSVTTSALAGLEHVAAQRAPLFSIRDFVSCGRQLPPGGATPGAPMSDSSGTSYSPDMPPAGVPGAVLFMPYQAGQIASLRALIATWLRLAIFEAMNGGEGDRRLWFVIDELDALGAIDGLKDALARLRKFGGRCVLGFQSIGQVSALYGRGDAQTIVENCGNTLILRCSASEGGGTAQFASQLIGQREVLRRHISRTDARDGTSVLARRRRSTTTSEQLNTEPAVLPAEIEQLPDLAGYVKLASQPDWLRVHFVPDALS